MQKLIDFVWNGYDITLNGAAIVMLLISGGILVGLGMGVW